MQFICYDHWNQLPESAEALFAQSEKDSLFFSPQWFENLTVTEHGEFQDILLACVVADDQVLALLPLMDRHGKTARSIHHRYTTHFSLLLAPQNQQQILDCLVQGLQQLPFKALLLEPIDENDQRIHSLQQALAVSGYTCERHFRFYNWIQQIKGQSFANYFAARPARLRNTIARKQRKLAREQEYALRMYTGDEVPAALTDYHAVYRASWKAYEQYADLLNGMVDRFSERGWSRLGVLYVKEQAVAAQLWFVVHGKASIFRLAYDEAWKRYSPGSILTAFMMEHVIDTDRVDEIDFLYGNDAYKQDWMSERRECWALSCINTSPPKPARRHPGYSIKHWGQHWLKRWLKSLRTPM